MPACYRLTLYVASFVFPTFSVFKVVYHEYSCIFSYVNHDVVSGLLGWLAFPFPRLDQKVLSRLVEYSDIIKGSFSALSRPSPTLSPSLHVTEIFLKNIFLI